MARMVKYPAAYKTDGLVKFIGLLTPKQRRAIGKKAAKLSRKIIEDHFYGHFPTRS